MHQYFKSLTRVAFSTGCLLLIPLFGNRYIDGWNWSGSDFVFAALLIGSAGLALDLALSSSKNIAFKIAIGIALVATFLLVWINAAVGLIGSDDNDFNLLYLLVIAIGFFGALASRIKPRPLSYTLFCMAIVQFTIPIIAFIFNRPDFSPGTLRVFALNGIFVALFVGAGMLFRQASEIASRSEVTDIRQ